MKLKTINDFIAWNLSTKTVTLKTIYVDITGDLIAGLLLSQIIYWNLPDASGKDTKLRIQKNDRYWLCKSRKEWWDEIRITDKQYDRASKIICDELDLIDIEIFKFNGTPKTHIAINFDVLITLLNDQLKLYSNRKDPFTLTKIKKINTTTKEDKYKDKLESYLNSKSNEYKEVFQNFVDYRKQVKRPMTEYAKYLMLHELQKYFYNDEIEHIRRFKNSIKNGWQGVIFDNEKKKLDNKICSDEGY
ncbi:MAG: hypothetical protein K9L62_16735 [Vallitaleaceae bacterium]|nr:hypothetical protein [Vallitaleaceae bacterium]